MPLTDTQSKAGCTCEEAATPLPETTPRLPVVQICSDRQLDVYYSEIKAVNEAFEYPEDKFYDARGIELTRVGSDRLVATGEAHPDQVRALIMDVLNTAYEHAGLEGQEAIDAQQLIAWLEGAPTLAELMCAMLPPEPEYAMMMSGEIEDDGLCRPGCSYIERLRKGNRCCPAS